MMCGGGGGGGDEGGITTTSSSSSSRSNEYWAKKMTWFVLQLGVICVLSGLMLGYEIGIMGGVLLKPKFVKANFPKYVESTTSQYCTFDSIGSPDYSLFYLTAWVGTIYAFSKLPRKSIIIGGGIVFLVSAALSAAVVNFGVYILGAGFGCIIQAVPKYISETVHYKYLNALNASFQMMITIGIFIAYLVNYGTNNIDNGWGLKAILCIAAVPAIILTIGSWFLPNTPNFIFEKGEVEKAKYELRRMHGSNDVDEVFNNILTDHELLKTVNSSTWRGGDIWGRKNRPYLVMSIVIPIFQQLTGISSIILYAPLLFKSIGFGTNASLKFVVITGGVNVAATLLAIVLAIRLRRRLLLIGGGVLMFLCHIIVGTLIWDKLGGMSSSSSAHIAPHIANLVTGVAMICIYVSSFAWSWGPLGWLVPNSEVFPLEIRSAGERMTATTNMWFAYIIAILFFSMLCHLKFGIFYIFAFFALTMTIFATLFIPETKGIPIEEMSTVWMQHWFWKRYVTNPNFQNVNGSQIDLENNPSLMSSVTIA